MTEITIFGEADQKTIEQMRNCINAAPTLGAALMSDNHLGYSQPVGGVVAYPDHLSVSGAGYDLCCGNKAVRTNLKAADVEVGPIMDEILTRVGFGVGRANAKPFDHEVIDKIKNAEFAPQRAFTDLARTQLASIGSGNHFLDLFCEEITGDLWIGVHFGSRGFGHKTASGFFALAAGLPFESKAPEGEPMSDPILLEADSELGQSYLAAIELAGEYAYAGRDVVCDVALEILGATSTYEVHNHHNHIWREKVQGTDCWVVRKGATPAFPGQEGFIGASMAEDAVIIRGTDGPDSDTSLHSTVHGAGRAMSRTEAKGRSRRRWVCSSAGCGWIQGPNQHKPDNNLCPDCESKSLVKKFVQVSEGKIDWGSVREELAAKNIELRGGGADEAPGAYKRLTEVLKNHNNIEILHTLTPIGVAMAGSDEYDPYKAD